MTALRKTKADQGESEETGSRCSPSHNGSPSVQKTPITGIGGVLGGLISDDPSKPKPPEPSRLATRDNPERRSHARVGRPPGKASPKAQRREKLTVRIDADLVEKYRDWSWDARCNLGELVGRAMQRYLKTRSEGN